MHIKCGLLVNIDLSSNNIAQSLSHYNNSGSDPVEVLVVGVQMCTDSPLFSAMILLHF